MKNAPDLSIVVAGVLPWPALRNCLDSIYSQAMALGAEVIVATRNDGLPDDVYPGITRIVEPNGTLFSLRAAGFASSTGDVVALTEDHCNVRPDWCASVLEAHRARPEAMAIIGCVENTARERYSEWAAYILGNGPFMSPLPHGVYGGEVTSANASFKRAAMPEHFPSFGWCGDWYTKWLREHGQQVVLDETPVVDHHLTISMSEAVPLFYRAARASVGIQADLPAGGALARVALDLLMTPINTVRTGLRIAIRKGRFRSAAFLSMPFIALLGIAHQTGVLLGALRGPGSAAHRLY